MIIQATQHLIATVRDASSSDANMRTAALAVLNAVTPATVPDANDALTELAEHISMDDLSRSAFLALVCGAMVENGCDPMILSKPLNQRLKTLLKSSAQLADASNARMPKTESEDSDPTEEFEKAREQAARDMPRESAAWDALNQFWRPGIAVFSRSPSARVEARGLRALAANFAEHHEGAHWLRLMLSVLDNEPTLVIEPQTQTGMLARSSGVVDNFQLHVLLMDEFPRSKRTRRRVSKRVADCARGQGPQQTDDTVNGVWNLHTWKAIQPDLSLPDPNDYKASDNWIWGEGSPEDIPVFEGRRTILLGPASYSRGWGCQRKFDALPASLTLESQLPKDEVTNWLQRMAAAKAPS